MSQRARNLRDTDVAAIVGILDSWNGKLSWELLLAAIEFRMHQRYTRQALSKHSRILQAFQLRKAGIAESGRAIPKSPSSPELEAALQRIARLESENLRLEAERANLLEQFARWTYNAHTRGLGLEVLNKALPEVNRDQTRRTQQSTKRGTT